MNLRVEPITVPFELYPPLEMTVLDIRLAGLPDSAFRIWLPEMVNVGGHGTVYNQAQHGPQQWQRDESDGRYECSVFQSELLRVASSLDLSGRRALLRYEVENLSGTSLQDIELISCYQLAHAPDFRDVDGQRTCAWVSSRLANVTLEGRRPECHDHHDPASKGCSERVFHCPVTRDVMPQKEKACHLIRVTLQLRHD